MCQQQSFEVERNHFGYLFLDTDCMAAGETWGSYMGRLGLLLPDWILIISGRYVEDIREEQCVGQRFLQGEDFLNHASGFSGHYLQLVLV